MNGQHVCSTLCLLLIFSAASRASAQVASGCNNLTRRAEILPGTSPPVTQDCPRIMVTVGVVEFQTPAECIVAFTQQIETVWSCGPAASGLNCIPDSSKAFHASYHDGGCPSTVGLTNGQVFSSWDEVPSDVIGVIQGITACTPPIRTLDFDYSARCRTCPEVELPRGPTPLHRESDLPGVSRWTGDPREAFDKLTPYDPFLTEYDRAMAGGHVSDRLLASAMAAAPGVPGMRFEADIEVLHFDAGHGLPVHRSSMNRVGALTRHGTFDCVDSSIVESGGEAVLVKQRLAFDGFLLFSETQGAEEGNVYTLPHAVERGIWRVQVLPELLPLHAWIVNPYGIATFDRHRFSVERWSGKSSVEKHTADGTAIDKTYLVDTDTYGVPVVLQSIVLDRNGQTRERTSFANFAELAPGLWRPLEIHRELFLDGDPDGRHIELSYEIRSASVLTDEEARSVSRLSLPRDQTWNLWF